MDPIKTHLKSIENACKSYGVSRLYVFGSVLTDRFSETSDIDFLVDFSTSDPIQYGQAYFAFKFSLEKILKHPVDLLEIRAIKNKGFKSAVSTTMQLIYETGNQRLA